ncbi:Beta-ketoacyl synthase [Verrucomicrobia bacterium]|nr:Beta-ketoacyl synthase [Verrucomicrobiota bacterium]
MARSGFEFIYFSLRAGRFKLKSKIVAVLFPARLKDRSPPRVVITGAGIITALGQGWQANALGFRQGRVAFRPVSLFDVSRQRVKVAAEVNLPAVCPETQLSGRELGRMDRAGKLLLWAAHEALQQAGWGVLGEERGEGTGGGQAGGLSPVPIVLGTTSGGMSLGEAYYRQAIQRPDSRRRQATRVLYYQMHRQGMDLARAFGLDGPLTTLANACASGANAIGHAWDMLRQGQAQRALAGGYDALSQLVFSGFDALQALSPTRCRPFDQHRDGLALGEGAAILALETLECAQRRGAAILGEIAGYGAATDVHHLTQPHPNGDAAVASMSAACASAKLTPDQIDYVNAHGTGTPLNDSAEAAAINRWAGGRARTLPVSSVKSSIGHLLGAAGAVEAVVCLMALREQWLPPTSTLETPEPACDFPVVREPTEARLECVLTNSFGFGGANASLILRKWKGAGP